MSPRFSVLLPTRNRLELLRYAVESVVRQDYPDWELVISDNCSEDDIAGYVASLADSRVKHLRTPSFVPVTDNWNNAVRHSTGDYAVMLGDDDCLMQGYFRIMAALLEKYSDPEYVYTDAYLFAYPGVLPDHPKGYLRQGYNTYFRTRQPYILDRVEKVQIARKSLGFIPVVHFNMQLSLVSRELIARLADRGPFFQSHFPDYYATMVCFITASRTLVYQQPVVTIGISPKSYGYFHFNRQQETGKSFLYGAGMAIDSLDSVRVPGSWENDGWLSAAEAVRANYRGELERHRLKVGYARYRRLQMLYNLKGHLVDGRVSREELVRSLTRFTLWERVAYGLPLGTLAISLALLQGRARQRAIGVIRRILGRRNILAEPKWQVSEYANIMDVWRRMPPELPQG
jgi:glycosyltransferase involved in cell wall biosynthesis